MKKIVTVKSMSGSEFDVALTLWKSKRVYNDFNRDYYAIESRKFNKNNATFVNRQLATLIDAWLDEMGI